MTVQEAIAAYTELFPSVYMDDKGKGREPSQEEHTVKLKARLDEMVDECNPGSGGEMRMKDDAQSCKV